MECDRNRQERRGREVGVMASTKGGRGGEGGERARGNDRSAVCGTER